jgi:hypothetical protein
VTEKQFYLTVGLPSIAVLIGMLINGGMIMALSGRMSSIESRMAALETRFQNVENKFDTRFDLLMGKVFEIDNRLTRVEEQLKHLR